MNYFHSIFLTPEILQAFRAVRAASRDQQEHHQQQDAAEKKGTSGDKIITTTMLFALLAALEVTTAFVAAAIAIAFQLYVGEVTDAIEVGVGLLFVRELSARAYHGIRHKGVKQYQAFFGMLLLLLVLGFAVEATCESLLGGGGGERRRR